MSDPHNEDQKVAAVRASMIMAGQPLSSSLELEGRRILRGEITADQSVLEYLEAHGLGDTPRATELRRRISGAA